VNYAVGYVMREIEVLRDGDGGGVAGAGSRELTDGKIRARAFGGASRNGRSRADGKRGAPRPHRAK
jgi:hypothetical protein